MIRWILSAGIVMMQFAAAAWAGPERISFPTGYETAFTNYLSLDRVSNDDQIIRLFANDIALEGARGTGELPDGSVIVGEIYKARLDAEGKAVMSELGRRIRDGLAAIVVMEKGAGWGSAYPKELEVGDWEFALFSPQGEPLQTDFNKCRACHAPLVDRKFVFSYEHMLR